MVGFLRLQAEEEVKLTLISGLVLNVLELFT